MENLEEAARMFSEGEAAKKAQADWRWWKLSEKKFSRKKSYNMFGTGRIPRSDTSDIGSRPSQRERPPRPTFSGERLVLWVSVPPVRVSA